MTTLFKRLFGGDAAPVLSAAEAKTLVQDGAILIDVRTPAEVAGGTLPGAVNVPLDKITADNHGLSAETTYVLFCRSGQRSGRARAHLSSHGIPNVHDLGSWTREPWPV